MKSKTSAIAFCGIIIALSMVFMMFAFIPNFTYTLPALAGALLVAVVIEVNIKYAFISYLAVMLLSILLVPDKFSVLLYACFFGYYPIIKALFERAKGNFNVWIYKFVSFNIVILGIYFFAIQFLNFQDNKLNLYVKSPIGAGILLVANIVFVIYDLAIDNVIGFYLKRMHNSVKKSFK